MPDRAHAANAKARASEFASPAVKAEVDRKADRILGKGDSAREERHEPMAERSREREPKGAPMGKHHSEHGFRTHSREGK